MDTSPTPTRATFYNDQRGPRVDLDPLGLKDKRERLGMTQLQLAIRAELTPATISRLENGHQAPNLRTCQRLANGLGLSLPQLLGSKMNVRPPRGRRPR